MTDELDDVRNRGNFLYFDPELAQLGAEKIGVGILGFSRQDLVPKDDDTGALRQALYLLAQRNRHPQHSAFAVSGLEFRVSARGRGGEMEGWSDGLAMIAISSTAAPHAPSPE